MGAGIVMMAATALVATAEEAGKEGFLGKVEQWQDSMSDKFGDTWRKLRSDGGNTSVVSASVDLREQIDSYTVRLNLPGRDLDKVQIKLEGETLRIVAPAEKAGSYEQTVVLAGADTEAEPRIERKKEDDLIVVTLPKKVAERDPHSFVGSAVGPLSPLSNWESDVVKRMEEMRREMDDIFEEAFGELRLSPEHKGRYDHRSFGAFVDLKEVGSDYIVTAYLPERDVKNVNVAVEGQALRIEAKAETVAESDKDGQRSPATRRAYYSQLLKLPGPVQADKMKVERKEGVLTVALPKAE